MGANKKRKRRRAELDDRHYLAIELLTTVPTPNLDDIARHCYVDRRTLYRWRLRKDFQRELTKAQERKHKHFRLKLSEIRRVEDFEFIFRAAGLI
ncbi:phBC6A51 family helix-turn-helix protein [Paenibacillus polysaccharolyticus]|uniref:phBC6A51 family helix-turn-helix protein n=1 Tax=Paenibacillus polysaccharolyticus TaxID=582692 RepID=UPI00300AA78E